MSNSVERLSLALLVDATAPAAADEAAAAQATADAARRDRQQRAGGRRSEVDRAVIGLAVAACVTVLIPYLVGHFLIRKTPLLAEKSEVYLPEIRGLGDHFWPDYLGGVCAIALPVATFLVVRPWAFRTVTAVAGAVLLALTLVVLLPTTSSAWNEAEATSAAKLRETPFPFSDRYLTCASWTFEAQNGLRQNELWQVYLAQFGNTAGSDCNRVQVYRGRLFVGTFDLDGGDTFTKEITVNSPDWSHPYNQTGSGNIYGTENVTGRHIPLNPNSTGIALDTATGRVLTFTLDGAGHNGFAI